MKERDPDYFSRQAERVKGFLQLVGLRYFIISWNGRICNFSIQTVYFK
jgi:hypothetical protein